MFREVEATKNCNAQKHPKILKQTSPNLVMLKRFQKFRKPGIYGYRGALEMSSFGIFGMFSSIAVFGVGLRYVLCGPTAPGHKIQGNYRKRVTKLHKPYI